MTHGPVGDSASGVDYEESEHSGRVVRIASVAALGGLLFGYDSAVINGAVSAIEDDIRRRRFQAGLRGGVGAARGGRRRDHRRQARRQDRPDSRDEDRGAAVLDQRDRCRPFRELRGHQRRLLPRTAERCLDAGGVPDHRRHRRRRGLRHRADVHRGDLAAAHPRAARLAATAGDRDGHFPVAGDRLPAGASGRRLQRRVVAGAGGLALDVPHDGAAGDPLRCAGLHHSRVAALPRREIPHSGGPQGSVGAARREEPRVDDHAGSRNR